MDDRIERRAPRKLIFRSVAALVKSMNKLKDRLMPPQAALLNMMTFGMITSRAVYVAAELGLADMLKDRPMTIEEMAAKTGVHSRSLYRVMRVLVSLGVFTERKDHQLELTALGEYLRTDIPGSMCAWARFMGAEWHWSLWGKMLDSVRNGRTACENLYGDRLFGWLEKNPHNRLIFDEAMTSRSEKANSAIISAYDFSSFGTLVDIGGGHGSLLAAILRANPAIKGILFELPDTIERAREETFWKEDGLASRCKFVSGNFFKSIPSGADACLIKATIHDWNDQEAVQILKNCRQAMSKGKKVLLVEQVLPDNHELFPGKFLDLGMLILTGGCERTEAEYQMLLESSGFKLSRIIPTASADSIVEGVSV